MKTIKISEDLALPLDAVTQTFGILAMRGAGKSNTAAAMAEEMFKAGLPFVVVDPVGAWYGLRSSADGKTPGLPLPIFGGRHQDIPLEKTGGQMIADTVVDQRLSCVIDISELSEGDKTRFLIDFAERLYRRNQDPLHLFLEEADDFIPQRPFREQARCLRAWENIVRRGRQRGLGITMITQRSAALNKNVLTQAETLIVLRTTSPQDRKAIGAWVEYHGQAKALLESLPELEAGEAWVWSPQWLKILKRVQIRRRETFDSGATPKDVKGGRPPATLADVDLGHLREQMAATIERAKAEDPRELRKRIAELEKLLGSKKATEQSKNLPEKTREIRVEVPVLKEADIRRLEKAVAHFEKDAARTAESCGYLALAAKNLREDLERAKREPAAGSFPPRRPWPPTTRPDQGNVIAGSAAVRPPAPAARGNKTAAPSGGKGRDLGVGERRILAAAAQYQDGVTREQLTVLTGYKRSSRDTYVQRLRASELVVLSGDRIVATSVGIEALGDYFDPLPEGEELRAYWLNRLPVGEKKLLEVLIGAYPKAVDRSLLSDETGYQRSSRDTYIQRLRSRQLVEVTGPGELRASEQLFS